MKDAFIICTDGLKGFPEAIEAIFPSTLVQTCIVHLNRGSFPTQEAAIKLLYMALQNVSKKWHTVQNWREAMRQFSIRWPERMQPGLGS
jgi:transposase-like protein